MKITRNQLRQIIKEAMITEEQDPRTAEIMQAREKMKIAGREFWDALTELQPDLSYQMKMNEVQLWASLDLPSQGSE